MEAVCKVCRRTIAPGDGALFQAFGRPLFVVHRSCAQVVHGGMRTIGQMVFHGARTVMTTRAPKALAVLDALGAANRRLAVNNAREAQSRGI